MIIYDITSISLAKKKRSYKKIDYCIASLVILNVYAQFFKKITGINSFVFLLLPIVVTIFLAVKYNRHISINKPSVFFATALLVLPIIQIVVIGFNVQMIKYSLYLLLYLLLLPVIRLNTWKIIKKTCFVIGIALNLDALIHIPEILSKGVRIFNIKGLLIVDKPYYSLFLTLTIVFIVLDVIYKKQINKLAAIIYILISTIINIVFMQSKSAILAFLLACVVMTFSARRKTRNKILIGTSILGVGLAIFFSYRKDLIPDYLKAAFAYLMPSGTGNALYDRYNLTFNHRSIITNYVVDLTLKNPILGVGFGNYSGFASSNLVGYATETESSILNVFVEGGIPYGILFCLLNLYLLLIFFRKWRSFRHSKEHIEMFIVLVLLIIFCIQNDYISVYYWIIMASISAYILHTKRFFLNNNIIIG